MGLLTMLFGCMRPAARKGDKNWLSLRDFYFMRQIKKIIFLLSRLIILKTFSPLFRSVSFPNFCRRFLANSPPTSSPNSIICDRKPEEESPPRCCTLTLLCCNSKLFRSIMFHIIDMRDMKIEHCEFHFKILK